MFFSSTNDEKLVLILGVESGAVRGSLTLISPSCAPKVIFSHEALIPWKPHTDSRYLIKTTEKAVKETVEASLQRLHMLYSDKKAGDIPRKISSVHFAMSSPWIVSRAKLISVRFDKDTAVDRAYIMKLVGDERAKMIPEQSEPVRVVEEKIFDVRLNGYSVNDWQDKGARALDISFTVSVAGAHTIDRFAALCEHAVHPHQVHFHSSLLLQFIGIEKSLQTSENYAIIHVHGELTDVAMVHDRSCIFFGSYPFGVRTMVRKVAASTKTDGHAADSLIALYTGGKLDPAQDKKAGAVIESVSEGWAKELDKVLLLSPQDIRSSANIVISARAHEDSLAKMLHKLYPAVKITAISETDMLPIAINGMEQK